MMIYVKEQCNRDKLAFVYTFDTKLLNFFIASIFSPFFHCLTFFKIPNSFENTFSKNLKIENNGF